MKILYSFNKEGFEAEYWTREIADASTAEFQFLPFNHGPYLDPFLYRRAQLLDDLYFARDPRLLKLYSDFEQAVELHNPDAVIVDNFAPYHPDYLRLTAVYKVLRCSDGPVAAYDRDFAYLHAYDQIFYHSPAYSADIGMADKLRYCGAANVDFWPLGLFDVAYDPNQTEDTILRHDRDIDILFIGTLHFGKMPFLSKIKKAFGRRCRLHGLTNWKRNAYFNLRHGFPGWIRPVAFEDYVPLYQRAKIGFNVHNRGDYTVGSYRLFDLPANGVMQLSDGGEYLNDFFSLDEEIVGYAGADDLIDKLQYYLDHEEERKRIAVAGFRRVIESHRMRDRMAQAEQLIQRGMARAGHQRRRCASQLAISART